MATPSTTISALLDTAYAIVWGWPLLSLITLVGLYLTWVLRGLQFRKLRLALAIAFGKNRDESAQGDISHFQSLMTALAATMGIGNIAGVATALTAGGVGALFWMWVTALLGMATKYAEAILAVRYRSVDKNGQMCGGPMYFIEQGLQSKRIAKVLAASFAFFGITASFGGGNLIQANSVAEVLKSVFNIEPVVSALLLALCTALSLLGGIYSIGKIASLLVPFMALTYIAGASYILLSNFSLLPSLIASVFIHAFTPQAAFGGFLGASVVAAVQVGISRGLMTSEAGLGTASIAAAAAKTSSPARQALVSMTGGFIATIIMCSLTAFVILVTESLGALDGAGQILTGGALTAYAFSSQLAFGGLIVTVGLILFAFTTLIGWAYYGEKCVEYLFGVSGIIPFRVVFVLLVAVGALSQLEIVWKISDIFNGLMAIPNLIGVVALSSVVVHETQTGLS